MGWGLVVKLISTGVSVLCVLAYSFEFLQGFFTEEGGSRVGELLHERVQLLTNRHVHHPLTRIKITDGLIFLF